MEKRLERMRAARPTATPLSLPKATLQKRAPIAKPAGRQRAKKTLRQVAEFDRLDDIADPDDFLDIGGTVYGMKVGSLRRRLRCLALTQGQIRCAKCTAMIMVDSLRSNGTATST